MGNKLEEVQLSVSSSAMGTLNNQSTVPEFTEPVLMHSSLLIDVSASVATHYDSSLVDLDLSHYPAEVPAANDEESR
ncbi:hypothetical protein MLD38_015631 [Melastoma candidum]|nr:hypothetical protein MLD38_015631 [Melastoma candidum]